MTILSSNFNIVNKDGPGFALGGIWDSLEPAEVATAIAAGSGAGVPDSTGTITLGAIQAGHICSMDTNGHLVLGSSPTLSASLSQMFFVVFEGDNDFSGAAAGQVSCVHGGVRIETTLFSTGQVWTPGAPVICVSGLIQPEATANDQVQVIGWVGPNGLNSSGILDVYLCQGRG
jgi:hypothetical protein